MQYFLEKHKQNANLTMLNHLALFLVDRAHASKVYQVCIVATLTNLTQGRM